MPENTQASTQAEALRKAPLATLEGRASTDASKALVAEVCAALTRYEYSTGVRTKGSTSTDAVDAFVADLIIAQDADARSVWVFRSLKASSFSGQRVGYTVFKGLLASMKALGLVEHVKGIAHWSEGFPQRDAAGQDVPNSVKPIVLKQWASRFRATQKLVGLCRKHGVHVPHVRGHFDFDHSLPAKPILLRDGGGKSMQYTRTPLTDQLQSEVHELNEFLDGKVDGGAYRGYIRIFNKGDDPDFEWRSGGRLYSQPAEDNYQQMSEAERLALKLDGEDVIEIDISACNLTIFHAWHGVQLDATRAYELADIGVESRELVKSWIVATFGKAALPKKWPTRLLAEYRQTAGNEEQERPSAAKLNALILTKHPLLKEWGKPFEGRARTWADLMYEESAVVMATMLELKRKHGVPSLAMHDAIIVPKSQAELAAETLKHQFQLVTGVVPTLKTSAAPRLSGPLVSDR